MSGFDELQFYPTPKELAKIVWNKFQTPIVRVLEPSAGNGDLAMAEPDRALTSSRYFTSSVDCIEIDITRHARLKELGFNVVGVDFMDFENGSQYSHIVMNPPFREGVHHVLKAWNILWNGEIVAILNAETVRNPNSKERQLLLSLIERFGSVEYLQEVFQGEGVERKTPVEIALVYLHKKASLSDFMGSILPELQQDDVNGEDLARDYDRPQELAIKNTTIENAVIAFQLAVNANRELVFADAKAQRYTKMLGDTMAVTNGGDKSSVDTSLQDKASVEYIQRTLHTKYEELKDRAWTGILRSSKVTDRLSSAGQKQVESQFEEIKSLDFTVSNVYGFLLGIVQNQGNIQTEMACSVFDEITKYHTDNAVFYKGWKSNDKHRTAGIQIKTTRFVLPHHNSSSYSGLDWNSRQLLADFDKVFAMLDGKVSCGYGLNTAFTRDIKELRSGERIKTEYFDVRHYPGAGTIHFFPTRKDLIDRLNRLVGRHRKWLPPQNVRVSDNFWLQYDSAVSLDKAVQKKLKSKKVIGTMYNSEVYFNLRSYDDERKQNANNALVEVIEDVLEDKGILTDFYIEADNTTGHDDRDKRFLIGPID